MNNISRLNTEATHTSKATPKQTVNQQEAASPAREIENVKDSFSPSTPSKDIKDARTACHDENHHKPGKKFDPDDHISDFVKNTEEPVSEDFYKTTSNPKTIKTITIFHTNDMHGNLDPNRGKGGMAYVAGKINELKKNTQDYILVDSGDISYCPPYSDRNRFNPMPEIMNKMGYTVGVTGNHEFQWEAHKYGGPTGNPNP
ncbi:MAG: metallophosphoesterase, partial [Vulcanimicrobiota bacterium]